MIHNRTTVIQKKTIKNQSLNLFLDRIMHGNLFVPLLIITTGVFIFFIYFRMEGSQTTNYNRITIPMKNFIVPPPVKSRAIKQPQAAKTKNNQNEQDNSADIISLKRLYLVNMVQRINRNKRYPLYEQRKNKEGSVKIKLTISREGRILGLQIITPSRFSAFNQEAKAAIYRSSPFGKFPALILDKKISVIFHIVFRLS